jgi:hypothetical protein
MRPQPMQPMYDFSAAPEPVSLFQGSAEYVFKGERHVGRGDAQLRFLPMPRVHFHGKFAPSETSEFLFFLEDAVESSFSFNSHEIEGFRVGARSNSEGWEVDWTPRAEPLPLGDMQAKVASIVISHLFNFPDFRGGHHQATSAPEGCSLLVLESEDWRILLQSLPGSATHHAMKRAREEGGCFLTHVVKLERRDSTLFSGVEAEEQRFMLANFLSFLKGGSCWPVCEVGLEASGALVWQAVASPRVSSPAYSWFEPFKGHHAEVLFPLFERRWRQSDAWRDCLKHAVYWYTQANTNGSQLGIDSAIILAQTALERLAHHHVVIDRKMLSAHGFKDLRASDKLRVFFSSLSIPTDITAATPSIQNAATQLKWIDAPHALTDIRNALVHPDNNKRVHDCFVDAWRLGLWYLELSILALCDYTGGYQNRLSPSYPGQVRKVPWS